MLLLLVSVKIITNPKICHNFSVDLRYPDLVEIGRDFVRNLVEDWSRFGRDYNIKALNSISRSGRDLVEIWSRSADLVEIWSRFGRDMVNKVEKCRVGSFQDTTNLLSGKLFIQKYVIISLLI